MSLSLCLCADIYFWCSDGKLQGENKKKKPFSGVHVSFSKLCLSVYVQIFNFGVQMESWRRRTRIRIRNFSPVYVCPCLCAFVQIFTFNVQMGNWRGRVRRRNLSPVSSSPKCWPPERQRKTGSTRSLYLFFGGRGAQDIFLAKYFFLFLFLYHLLRKIQTYDFLSLRLR